MVFLVFSCYYLILYFFFLLINFCLYIFVICLLRHGQPRLAFASCGHALPVNRSRKIKRCVCVVWDEYLPDSLKAETRSKRGKEVRRRVEPSNAIPGNWKTFQCIDENKVELFSFLATTVVASIDCSKQIICTHRTEVLFNQSRDVSGLAPCTHEDADARTILYLEVAVKEENAKISICTVDTDVVVLVVISSAA